MGRGGVIANPLQSDRLLTILDASTDEEIGARLDRASDGHKPYSTFARLFDRSGRPLELYEHGGRSEKRMTDEEFEAALARPLGETA